MMSSVIHRFDNGYGASVITHGYGGEAGLFELAVIEFLDNEDEWIVCYDTPVTDDVIGWLTDEKVNVILKEIESL